MGEVFGEIVSAPIAPVDSADSHHLLSAVVFAGAVERDWLTGPVMRSRAGGASFCRFEP
jgi:hypothetical protein